MKYRYFPWLGFKTLTTDEIDLYELDHRYSYKALVFEWLSLHLLIVARASLIKDTDAS